MIKGKLARTSVFLGQDQLEQLRQISTESGIPLAVMIRRGVQLYIGGILSGYIPGLGLQDRRMEPDSVGATTISATLPSTRTQ